MFTLHNIRYPFFNLHIILYSLYFSTLLISILYYFSQFHSPHTHFLYFTMCFYFIFFKIKSRLSCLSRLKKVSFSFYRGLSKTSKTLYCKISYQLYLSTRNTVLFRKTKFHTQQMLKQENNSMLINVSRKFAQFL